MHNLPWQEAKLFIRNDDTNIEKVNIKLDLMESANGVVRKKENLHLVQVFLLRMRMVNIEKFINQYVTKRSESMFAQDINANEEAYVINPWHGSKWNGWYSLNDILKFSPGENAPNTMGKSGVGVVLN